MRIATAVLAKKPADLCFNRPTTCGNRYQQILFPEWVRTTAQTAAPVETIQLVSSSWTQSGLPCVSWKMGEGSCEESHLME